MLDYCCFNFSYFYESNPKNAIQKEAWWSLLLLLYFIYTIFRHIKMSRVCCCCFTLFTPFLGTSRCRQGHFKTLLFETGLIRCLMLFGTCTQGHTMPLYTGIPLFWSYFFNRYHNHCSLLTTNYSMFTTHYSLFTAHCSLLTAQYSVSGYISG